MLVEGWLCHQTGDVTRSDTRFPAAVFIILLRSRQHSRPMERGADGAGRPASTAVLEVTISAVEAGRGGTAAECGPSGTVCPPCMRPQGKREEQERRKQLRPPANPSETSELRRLKLEGQEFEASLGYIVVRSCLNKKRMRRKKRLD